MLWLIWSWNVRGDWLNWAHDDWRTIFFLLFLGSYEDKLTEASSYSNQENINYSYGPSCNKIHPAESMGTAYIEDSCNTKNMCLYKEISSYDICKPVETDETHEFLNQVDNNNFNITYDQSESQYASCSSHNISMISSACYTTNSSAVNYTNMSYNAVYPIKDVNKNYEEVSFHVCSSWPWYLTLRCFTSGGHRNRQWRSAWRCPWVWSVLVHQTSSAAVRNTNKSPCAPHTYKKHTRDSHSRTRPRWDAGPLQPSGIEGRQL